MDRALDGMRQYPVVVATIAVGLVGGALELAGQPTTARPLPSSSP